MEKVRGWSRENENSGKGGSPRTLCAHYNEDRSSVRRSGSYVLAAKVMTRNKGDRPSKLHLSFVLQRSTSGPFFIGVCVWVCVHTAVSGVQHRPPPPHPKQWSRSSINKAALQVSMPAVFFVATSKALELALKCVKYCAHWQIRPVHQANRCTSHRDAERGLKETAHEPKKTPEISIKQRSIFARADGTTDS